jgi:hypothetical protein
MSASKHELYEVWREGYQWKAKLPHGIETFNSKKTAEAFSAKWKAVYDDHLKGN